jgi:hypothetical protein
VGKTGVPVKALLTRQVGQAAGLSQVAQVAGNQRQLKVQAAQAHQAHHIVKTDRGATSLPAGDRGLRRPSPRRQLSLSEPSPAARFPDQITPIRTHALQYNRSVILQG